MTLVYKKKVSFAFLDGKIRLDIRVALFNSLHHFPSLAGGQHMLAELLILQGHCQLGTAAKGLWALLVEWKWCRTLITQSAVSGFALCLADCHYMKLLINASTKLANLTGDCSAAE